MWSFVLLPVSVMTKAACPGLESLGVGDVGSVLFLGSASPGPHAFPGKEAPCPEPPESQEQAEVIIFRSGVECLGSPTLESHLQHALECLNQM